jgi:signal transduction histidine kinase
MTEPDIPPSPSDNLRKRAETALLSAETKKDAGKPSPKKTRLLLHELRLHQIELEKQNEELERRVAERTKTLQKIHSQLLHAEKLSAAGSLAASIAHELSNPLQGVMNVLHGVKKRATLTKDDAKLVEMAVTECHRMRDLIKNLQDFNRPTSGRQAPVDIHAAMDSVLLLSKTSLQDRGLTIKKKYAPRLPKIEAVADQIKQVFINLLHNAADACENGGTITIRTEARPGNIVVLIQDTGKGIRPENMARIFEPFFSTKPAVKGTGLGLSVSYGIVKAHGGEITVQSETGKGSVFSVILPLTAEKIDREKNPAG